MKCLAATCDISMQIYQNILKKEWMLDMRSGILDIGYWMLDPEKLKFLI
jgi:hypothetical protein